MLVLGGGKLEDKNIVQVISDNFTNLAESSGLANGLYFIMQLLTVILLFFIIYFLVHIGNQHIDTKRRVNIGKKHIVYFTLAFFSIVFILTLIKGGRSIYDMLSPFLYAIILAYILNPLESYIEKNGIKRIWAVFIVYFIVVLVIFLLSITLLPKMVNEIKGLLESLPELGNDSFGYIYNKYLKYNDNIENLPKEFQGVKELLKFDGSKIEEIILKILSSVTNSILLMVSKLLNLVLTPILAFYFLKDADKFKRILILSIPKQIRMSTINVAKDIDHVLGGFIRGQIIVAGIIGLLTTLALLILKVEFAVIVGIIAGVSNVIPYFGPIVGMVPAAIFASLGGLNKVIWVIGALLLIQQIESSIISPKIISDKVGVHPTVVILSLIIGGKYFGLFGLLIAVPVAGVIKVIGKHFINYIAKF